LCLVENLPVRALPMEIILPGMPGENELHPISSRSRPPLDSNSAVDSKSLRAFLGLRKR
jgi:hypothetical protein